MSRYCVYMLVCNSVAYVKSIMPPSDMIDIMTQIDHVNYHAGSFYTLAVEPSGVIEDAVRHLVQQRQELQREMREGLFEQFSKAKKFDWQPEEFDFKSTVLEDDKVNKHFTEYMKNRIAVEQASYIDLVRSIDLRVTEVLSLAHSQTIDKAKRFIINREEYLGQYQFAADTSTRVAVYKDLNHVRDLVEQRLLGRIEAQDELAKAVFDLEQRFPAENDI